MLELWEREWEENYFQMEFIDKNRSHFKSLKDKVKTLTVIAKHNQRENGSMIDNLLAEVKNVFMLPFSSILETFPKMVRNLSKDKGKEIELVLQGIEIEVDRRILEEMKNPLIHLLRNCIDHGIEKPKDREQNKKPPRGKIIINISRVNGNKVEILISDDGAGIDVAKVKESAVKFGIISDKETEKLSEQSALSLIFQSGVSTSPIITDISGRGLGLAIVKEKVEKLGGTISVDTTCNIGTSFKILLPLILTTFRGILISVSEQIFIIPTTNVERVIRIAMDEIKTIENKETVYLNGQTISYVWLGDVLELSRKKKKNNDSKFLQIVIINFADKRIAFGVDGVLNEQEILVKDLGRQLSRVRNISGATILGSGDVVPILNVSDLIKSAIKISITPFKATILTEEFKSEKKSILVVEDSIVSRMLLKNILESVGYNVRTAVDGIDALTILKTENFDLVVSDIEMPRMDGFDLTLKIRDNNRLSKIPIVLVTARESREDKERGIDVGANAYIVKSGFDQSNLLEIIQRLI
jgi:two-component system chemotaxis sensor kinase CheA